jgi:hypothetical protein
MSDINLPPRQPATVETRDAERLYRTALASRDYVRLEIESMERGLKPFGLTKSIMTLYLHKKLVLVSELPQTIQVQISDFYKESKKA